MTVSARTVARSFRMMLIALAGLSVVACSTQTQLTGNRPDNDKVGQIQPGASTKQDIVQLLGTPSTMSTFNDDIWYYISQKRRSRAFLKDRIDEQIIIAMSFDQNDVFQAANVFTRRNGRLINIDDEITPTSGRKVSIIQQLLGNIGRFSGGGN